MSSSESNDEAFNAFLESLKPKKKEKYRLSTGSLDDFLVDSNHVSYEEDSDEIENSLESLTPENLKKTLHFLTDTSSDKNSYVEDGLEQFHDAEKNEEIPKCGSVHFDNEQVSSPEYEKQTVAGTQREDKAKNHEKIKQQSPSFARKKVRSNRRIASRITPKHSTASTKVTSGKSFRTPKVIFSSDSDEEANAKPMEKVSIAGKLLKFPSSSDEDGETDSDNTKLESKPCTLGQPLEDLCSEMGNLDFVSTTYSSPEDEKSPVAFVGDDTKPSTSNKTISRILDFSSDESDSDVIPQEDESDKENFEKNIETLDFSSDEEKIVDNVFKTPKLPSKKPAIRISSDEEEDYKSLIDRVLRDKGTQEQSDQNKLMPRGLSEPKPAKSSTASTPARKPPMTSYTEKSKNVIQRRKDGLPPDLPHNSKSVSGFKRNRQLLTKKLYEYFNKTIFENKLPKDMIVEWDKRLTKTAGITKCSTRTVTITHGDQKTVQKTFFAKIHLSEKVLDTLQRLRDTLCHEMCHAAVWLIENQNDGHGPYWKAWTHKAMAAHPEMPIMKRCHSYEITYKYQYQCTRCRRIFGRHSKSIKVDKQVCGVCQGHLVLLPPKNADGTPAKIHQPNKFAMFVKENYKSTREAQSVSGMTPKHSDVMKALSDKFASLSANK